MWEFIIIVGLYACALHTVKVWFDLDYSVLGAMILTVGVLTLIGVIVTAGGLLLTL